MTDPPLIAGSDPLIDAIRDFYTLKVFIDGHLHVHIRLDDLLGVHSWLKPKPTIEYVLRGNTLVTEYDTREKWLIVLELLRARL